MDLIEQAYRWHPRFAPPVKAGQQLLLLSELESLLFESPAVMALSSLLEQGTSLRAHMRADPNAPMPSLMHALSSLMASGLVQTSEAHRAAPYVTPDFTGHLPDEPVACGNTSAWLLSSAIDLAQLAAWQRQLPCAVPRCTMVLCDDLLDPRLAAVAAWHRSRQRPWLLIKLTGEQASVGPVFDPGMHQAACWHCLEATLKQQQAGRAWAAGSPDFMAPVPIRVDSPRLATRLQTLDAPLMRALADTAQQSIWTWHDGQAPRRHLLSRRPQCPHCGDEHMRARHQLAPVVLQSRPMLRGAPGGSRSAPPERLTSRQSELLSPLIGPIIELAPVSANDETSRLKVYRSAFIRQPPRDGALPAQGFVQTCLGKGRTPIQSQASALGEAIERLAASYQGDEAVITATAGQLGPAAISPMALPRVQAPHDAMRHAPFDQATPVRWAPAWSITHDERRYLPLGYCFRDVPAEDTRHITWTSNGCAAGSNAEEAILQGMLELIERDATAIWWYNRLPRPAWPAASIPQDLAHALSDQLGAGWQCWVLDLTHDLGTPVAAGVAHHVSKGEWALGFGCHPDPTIAAERALTELAQLVAVDKCLQLPPGQDTRFLHPAVDNVRQTAFFSDVPDTDLATQIRCLVSRLRDKGFDTIVLDHSRPDLPLHTVKTAIPGLCHIWPEQKVPARLLTVPVQLGWLTSPIEAAQCNPQALFV